MLKAWRVVKNYLPLIIAIFGEIDVKALEAAEDKKEEFKKQVKKIFNF